MGKYTRLERLQIVLDITNKLKNFPTSSGIGTLDLYNMESNAIHELKEVFKQYINQNTNQNENGSIGYSGKIYFDEIKRTIEYILPIKNNVKPVFVLRYVN